MKPARITGMSSLVGRHLRDELLRDEWNIFGFEACPTGENIFAGDLSDRAALTCAITDCQPDAVSHLAGMIKSTDSQACYTSDPFEALYLLDTSYK